MRYIFTLTLALSLALASSVWAEEASASKKKSSEKAKPEQKASKAQESSTSQKFNDPMEEKSGIYADISDEALEEEMMDEVEEQWEQAEDKYPGLPEDASEVSTKVKNKKKASIPASGEGPMLKAVADVEKNLSEDSSRKNQKTANLSDAAKQSLEKNSSAEKKAMAKAKREEAQVKKKAEKGKKKQEKKAE